MSVRADLDNVSVRLGETQALDGVSLSIEPGSFVALLGPSGSGKTTTLNILAGFLRPDSGSVTFDGKPVTEVPPRKRDLGIVFQNYALFPHMTVGENVAFPLRMRGMKRAERQTRAQEALQLVGLGEHAHRSVTTLSGGQRQRVALARAIVFEPRMLLLDEPLAALDKQLREGMQVELRNLQRRVGITTVAVTHDQAEALAMADVVAVMRNGKIEQVGAPAEVYLKPASIFVANFLGEANVIPLNQGHIAGFGRMPGSASGHVVIRPEHVAIDVLGHGSVSGLTAEAEVVGLSFQGSRTRIEARLTANPDFALILTQSGEESSASASLGQRIGVRLDESRIHTIEGEHSTPEPPATRTGKDATKQKVLSE